jgi:hypothetical protein
MMVIPYVDRCGEAREKVPPVAHAIDPSCEPVVSVISWYVIIIHQGLLKGLVERGDAGANRRTH